MDPTFRPGKAANPVSQVELTISCKNLRDRDLTSKSDPICVLFASEFGGGKKFNEHGRTERIANNLNPDFAKKILIDYHFEESQLLRFEVYDIDSDSKKLSNHDFLGRTEVTLGEIIGAPGSKVHRKLGGMSGNAGSIIISAEETTNSKEVAYIHFQASNLDKKDFFGKSDPFLNIYRKNKEGTLTLAYRTEVVKNNLNPTWRQFKLTLQQLCQGERTRHDMIGSCEVTLNQLIDSNKNRRSIPLVNEKKKHKKKDSGQLVVATCKVMEEASFLDYIRGGTNLDFTVAVDFTASNGNPNDSRSLHYIHPHHPNQYMMALRAVGDICQDYNRDKMFVGLGFGAKIPPSGNVSHEFFLNGSPNNPQCQGLEGLMNAYRQSIMSVQLYGPTNFSPVINHVARIAAMNKDGSQYFILLIITDGVITDMNETIAAIVNASFLPMSIIIVGVGNDTFEAMEYLDCDKGMLTYQGRHAERDIVQFVPFRSYMGNQQNQAMSQARLAKDVLAEVPGQLTAFMYKRGIKAKPPAPAPDPSTLPPIEGLHISEAPYPASGPAPGSGPAPYPSSGPMPGSGPAPYPSPSSASGPGSAPYPSAGPMPGSGPAPYPSPSSAPGSGPAPYPTGPSGGPSAPGGAPYPANGTGSPYPPPSKGSAPPPPSGNPSSGRHSAGGGSVPYPSAPGQAPYTGSGSSPYPSLQGSSPYPSGGSPYPPQASHGGQPRPGQTGGSPYPSAGNAPYPPAGGAPYPGAGGGGAPYPPAGTSPYPPVGGTHGQHPTGGAPYPSAGSAPYPGAGGGGAPYPPAGSSPYPPVGGSQGQQPGGGAPYPQGGSPYPPAGSSPYPPVGGTHGQPQHSTGGAPYPQGGSPYPPAAAGGAPYPNAPTGGSPYPPPHGGSPYPGGAPYPSGGAPYPSAP